MWDVCSNNTPVANLSPSGNKFMTNNEDDDDGSAAGFRSPHDNGQRIKPFSPESHYKSQIFMQSVLDLHKSKSTLDLRDGGRNWSPEAHHPSQPCDVFPRFPPSIVDANLHHRLTRGSGGSGLPERFHHHPGLNGGPLMPGGGVVPSKLHGDLMRAEEKNVSSSTGIGSHQVKTFRAIRCYHCRMCDQEFVNKSDMQRHAKEIHRMEDKGYKCVKCLKSFPSSQQLAQHSLVHTNVRKYPCRYCDKAFKQLSHVQQHLRIHTGERPYQCAVEGCSKSFRQLSSLQQHIKGHNIPLPKSYSILHSAPAAGNDLPKDKIRTGLARPTNLICQICEKHCANEIRYFQHIHKHHPDFWRVFSSGRPLSDFIDVDEERPVPTHGASSRSLYGSSRMDRSGSMGGEDCGGGLLMGGEERGSSQSEPLLSCCVCKKLFAREAYLLRHLETNKEDEQHRASLIELRKDSAGFFAAARYDSGTLVDEIKLEGDSDMAGGSSSSAGGVLNEGRSSASNGVDDVFRGGSSSSASGLNVDDSVKMRSRSNSPSNGSAKIKNSQSGVEDLFQGRNSTNSDPQQQGILATSSSSSSSSATSDLELFSPSSTSAPASHLQTSSSQNNHSSHQSQHRFYSDQHQRFDACRGDTLPFSATPGPLYYSLSHGQSAFFGGRRRSNEAEQLYRRRSEVMNPFSSLDFSAGTRDFMGRDLMSRDLMGRDLIARDAMTPFYSPPHMDERRGTGSEEMFPGVGTMGGMFDHSAASAAAAGRLISGLRL